METIIDFIEEKVQRYERIYPLLHKNDPDRYTVEGKIQGLQEILTFIQNLEIK